MEKLRELAEKKTLSKEDKIFIVEKCKELGIEFNPKSGCKNCYFDMIFKIRAKIKELTPNEGCVYLLRPELEIDSIHREIRINADTLTNELAELLIKDGLKHWLIKIDENNENNPVE